MLHLFVLFIASLHFSLGTQLDLLGLARDFIFDITAANNDRIVFSSQGSGVQAFTFYSEGDLTDDIAFYLYGIWTHNGYSVPPDNLKLTLLKTRNGLPLERYNVTDLVNYRNGISTESQNIVNSLGRYCGTLKDFINFLQDDQLGSMEWKESIHPNLDPFLPRFPAFFEFLLSQALYPFIADLHEIPPTSPLQGVGRQVSKPSGFHFTWQKQVDDSTEMLSIVYDRGVFKLVMVTGTNNLLEILLTN